MSDPRKDLTIDELKEKKEILESSINDLLLIFEKDTGLPVVDILVEIHYPPETDLQDDKEKKYSRIIDVNIAL